MVVKEAIYRKLYTNDHGPKAFELEFVVTSFAKGDEGWMRFDILEMVGKTESLGVCKQLIWFTLIKNFWACLSWHSPWNGTSGLWLIPSRVFLLQSFSEGSWDNHGNSMHVTGCVLCSQRSKSETSTDFGNLKGRSLPERNSSHRSSCPSKTLDRVHQWLKIRQGSHPSQPSQNGLRFRLGHRGSPWWEKSRSYNSCTAKHVHCYLLGSSWDLMRMTLRSQGCQDLDMASAKTEGSTTIPESLKLISYLSTSTFPES